MDPLDAIAREPLDSTSNIPLYRQLEDRILQVIASRMVDEETPLPPELAICNALGLSRATVRRCFEDLVKDGRVVRRRGHGTFVAPPSEEHGIDVALNFTSRMKRLGKKASSRVIDFSERAATKTIAAALRIPIGTPLWEIKRLRLGDDVPLEYHIAYVPKSFCPNLTKDDLSQSLYALIAESSGTMPDSADEVFECVKIDKREAKILQLKPDTTAFRVIRTTYNEYGLPFEASISIYGAAHSKLRVHIGHSGTEFSVISE